MVDLREVWLQIADGLWSIGAAPSGIAVILCYDAQLLDSPGTILAIKAALDGAAGVLIAQGFSAPIALRLQEAGLSSAELGEVLVSAGSGTDRLAPERLDDAARRTAICAGAETAPELLFRIKNFTERWT